MLDSHPGLQRRTPVAQSVKGLESRLSAATGQPQKDGRHNAIEVNGSLGSFNAGSPSTSHYVPSSGTKDNENSTTYSVVKRSEKIVYSTDQQPRRFDTPAAVEAAKLLAPNQPRCRYCFRYLMSDRARDSHEKNSHPNGRTPMCNWNNSGCDKRIRNSNHLLIISGLSMSLNQFRPPSATT
jgi:hypothetical protein